GVGPVLAHTYPVAVAGDREGEVGPVPGHGEAGGAQVEQGAHLASGEGDAPHQDAGHSTPLVDGGGAEPDGGVARQVGPRVDGQHRLPHLVGGEHRLAVVVGDLLPLGALHALEVVHLVPPHLHRVHSAA